MCLKWDHGSQVESLFIFENCQQIHRVWGFEENKILGFQFQFLNSVEKGGKNKIDKWVCRIVDMCINCVLLILLRMHGIKKAIDHPDVFLPADSW